MALDLIYVHLSSTQIFIGVKMLLFLGSTIVHQCILIKGEGPIQGLDDASITAETKYSINFLKSQRKFCLSLYYIGSNSFLFVNATRIYQFKAKDTELKLYV